MNLESVFRKVRALRKSGDPCSFLEEQLKGEWSAEDRAALRSHLAGELAMTGRLNEARALLEADAEREPNEPFHSLRLSDHLFYYHEDLPLAKHHIAEAIRKAAQDGKFMYQALGTQARLSIELADWSLLEGTLRALSAYEHVPGNADVFPETDFLSRVPEGAVDSALIQQYTERVNYLRAIGYSTLTGAKYPARASKG